MTPLSVMGALKKWEAWMESLPEDQRPEKISDGHLLEAFKIFSKRSYLDGYLQALKDVRENYTK